MFDDGYEAYREWVLPRMIERGILPEGTELTPMNPMPDGTFTQTDVVRPWAELNDAEKAMFCRMAEVYAGFSEYTDAQVGRIVDYLEESGPARQHDHLLLRRQRRLGRGLPNGSVNEGKIFGGYPDDLEQNLAMVDQLGSPDAYNHYPTGWAMAFSTPYRMFKRYTYQGGVCDPLVIHWPAGIEGQGRGPRPVPPLHRHRPDDLRRLRRRDAGDRTTARADARCAGVSMRYSFDDADAPTHKETQYYEMLGTRGIWHKGWKAVTEHGPMAGIERLRRRPLAALPHRRGPLRGARRRRASTPRRSRSSRRCGWPEAKTNNVLPLNDLQIIGNPKYFETFIKMEFHLPVPPSGQYTYYPGTSEIPERSAANAHGVSYKVLAEVELTADTEGVIFAHGSRFGGHALFVKDGTAHLRLQLPRHPAGEAHLGAVPTSGRHIVGVEFTKERMGENREASGR